MNARTDEIATRPIDLTLELRCADGTSTEFYQTDEEHIRKTLRSLASPRLMTQSQLVLASERGVNLVQVRGVDMILARTAAQTPLIFPLIFPAGLLDISEVDEHGPDDDFGEEHNSENSQSSSPLVSRVEVHTLGGWAVVVKVLATTGNTVQDERNWFSHFMNLPAVAFRLQQGGIGLINPNNVIRVSACPTPGGVPQTALPVNLLRWFPSRIKTPTNLADALHS